MSIFFFFDVCTMSTGNLNHVILDQKLKLMYIDHEDVKVVLHKTGDSLWCVETMLCVQKPIYYDCTIK